MLRAIVDNEFIKEELDGNGSLHDGLMNDLQG